MEYALSGRGLVILSYPRDMAFQLAHLNEAWYVEHLDLDAEAKAVLADIVERMTPDTRLWLVGSERRINRPLFERLRKTKSLALVQHLQTPSMGIRRLDEPLFLERYELTGSGERIP